MTLRALLRYIVSVWSSYIICLIGGVSLLIRRWSGRLNILLEVLVWGINVMGLWRGVRWYSGFPPRVISFPGYG